MALYLDDSEAAELQMWSSTLQLSELEQLEGKVELTKTGIDNYHAVLATRSSQTLHESALRYRYMRGKPSGHSPSELTALTKTPLEIVPDPLPREHWRYTGNQTANFTITFNGEPLAGAWVGLTSSNGTTLESTSDAEGSVSFPVPDDFSRVMPGHSNNPKGEFIVRTGHVDNGRLYRTNLTADYRVDPGHWQSNGVALFMLGGGFAAGLLVTRRRNDPGVAIFAKVCFGHQAQANSKNLTRPFMPSAPRPSCVRCVITSSRLYTTPSVTLRRHKAAAASSSSSARALNYEYADGVDYRGLTALTSLSMAVSGRE
ncbi:hypothetical protein [Candidatus Reidiella endopervernicosa]|uniref:Uncharacterized protein n=1 Tax=Candidatus Reidiella endopervernicosa TaxID=2738883 RepID=A0A6N0HTM9_9GAMM|nr:hypothetical protein [Candidatus Reidiella endopervernicosa]QKQ25759.1 hypothetical protein HUE57_05270 [Candidatus Reidiella endopervernicosa]